MADFDLVYLSLGAGVDSTALLIAAVRGLHGIPRPDLVLFADTGEEAPWTYKTLDMLDQWSPIRITRLHPKYRLTENPRLDAPPPVFVDHGRGKKGQTRRQCTKEYKREPIERAVRSSLGYKPRQRVKHTALGMIGISWGERHRAKMSPVGWIVNDHPLIEYQLTRDDCRRIIESEDIPVPGKSSCVMCPYHDNSHWRAIRDNAPAAWEYACQYDEKIRNVPSIRGQCYLHPSLVPLRDANLGIAESLDLWEGASIPVCEGMCGV